MKTVLYVLVALFMGTGFTSCSPERLAETTEYQDTVGEDGNDPSEEEDED